MVTKLFLTTIFFILAIASQMALWPRLSVFGAAPNFILAVVLFLAVFRDFKYIWLVFFMGVFIDILGGKFFGAASAAFLLVFLFISWLAKQVFVKNSRLSLLTLGAIGVFSYQVAWFLLLRLGLAFGIFSSSAAADLANFLFRILPSSYLMNTLLVLICFYFFKKINERFV